MSDKKSKESRTRNWSVILYPDSAPDNWRGYLDELHIEWVESPLHDKDLNADGEPKKPHWHVLLMFGGVKAAEQILELIGPLNCPSPQKVHNSRALVRYMAHLDNPDKAQYSISEIIPHGGVDVNELLKPCSSERYALIKEMITFVKENNIVELQDLMDYAASERYDDWFSILCDSSMNVLANYIKSARHRNKPNLDYSTGELLD